MKRIACVELYKEIIDPEYQEEMMFIGEEELFHVKENQKEEYRGVEGLICMPYYITEELLACFPSLKWIQLTGAGYDKADTEAVRRRNIQMCNSRGVMSDSIAEDVFCKMLYFAKRIADIEWAQREHKWENFGAHQWLGSIYTDLWQQTIGIIGDGSIATEVARRAKAFSMKVIVYGRHEKQNPYFDHFVKGEKGLQKLAEESRFVICTLPYQAETYHLLDASFFEEMRRDAWFINIARGAIVNETALVEALKKRKIAGAGLDVFEQEPLSPDSPLWDMDNVLITAHKAGMGDSWQGKLKTLLNENILHFINKEEMKNVVIK